MPDFGRYPRLVLFLLLLAWCFCIVWLSLIPQPDKVLGFKAWDKLLHAGAYAVLALLSALVMLNYASLRAHAWRLSALLAWFFGFLVEIGQGVLTRSRRASVGDLIANAIGVLVIYLLGTLWMKLRQRTGSGP